MHQNVPAVAILIALPIKTLYLDYSETLQLPPVLVINRPIKDVDLQRQPFPRLSLATHANLAITTKDPFKRLVSGTKMML